MCDSYDMTHFLKHLTTEEDRTLYFSFMRSRKALFDRMNRIVTPLYFEQLRGKVRNPYHICAQKEKVQDDEDDALVESAEETAKPAYVRRMYRTLCLRYHPDHADKTVEGSNTDETGETNRQEKEAIFKKIQHYYKNNQIEQLETLSATGRFLSEEDFEINDRMIRLFFSPLFSGLYVTPEELVMLHQKNALSYDDLPSRLQLATAIRNVLAQRLNGAPTMPALSDVHTLAMLKSEEQRLRKQQEKAACVKQVDDEIDAFNASHPHAQPYHVYDMLAGKRVQEGLSSRLSRQYAKHMERVLANWTSDVSDFVKDRKALAANVFCLSYYSSSLPVALFADCIVREVRSVFKQSDIWPFYVWEKDSAGMEQYDIYTHVEAYPGLKTVPHAAKTDGAEPSSELLYEDFDENDALCDNVSGEAFDVCVPRASLLTASETTMRIFTEPLKKNSLCACGEHFYIVNLVTERDVFDAMRKMLLPICLQALADILQLKSDIRTVVMLNEDAKDYKNFFSLFPAVTFYLLK